MNGGIWIEDNYNILERWAKHWHPVEWRELLAHYVLYLDKNWIKFNNIPDNEQRIKFTQTWMKNSVNWRNSDFNKSIAVNNLNPDVKYDDNDRGFSNSVNKDFFDDGEYEGSEEQFIDIYCDVEREDIKDWLMDLHRNFGEEQVINLTRLRQIYLKMETHDKVMWDLYFTNMMPMRAISKKLDIPLSAVYNMINELKNKIKERCLGN